MSRTLFWYFFKDLLRIFLLASGALAGIMSFGGLLRPLTEHGLDSAQVGKMLTYLTPAMMTYSLPIAALFATTMVYGRLSADNELTACRAAGISHLSIATPALVLGLTVAIISLLFLCFIVPTFTLKVERVIYSNVAQLVVNKIERTHQLRMPSLTIYADRAYVAQPPPDRAQDQAVVLEGPMFVKYGEKIEIDGEQIRIPEDFYMAKQAVVFIRQRAEDDEATLEGNLDGFMKFPRSLQGQVLATIEQQPFGPIPIDSPVEEETKFMDIRKLKDLLEHPEQSRRIRESVQELIRKEQRGDFLRLMRRDLTGPQQRFTLAGSGDAVHTIVANGADVEVAKGRLQMRAARNGKPIEYQERRGDRVVLAAQAQVINVEVWPNTNEQKLIVDLEFHNAVVGAGDDASNRESFPKRVIAPMPREIRRLEKRSPVHYAAGEEGSELKKQLLRLHNSILGEMHARASFAISCFNLVVVGCALGMMFKSGNFLSAFAVSVVPALLCITLIVTGQQTCENVSSGSNPLNLGLALIWSGNVIVLILAIGLMWKLQRE